MVTYPGRVVHIKTIVFPIVGPTTIYPNGQRALYVQELSEQYEKQGYKIVQDKKWDTRTKQVFLWPHYIRKESLFSDNMESLVTAFQKGYDVTFVLDEKQSSPVITDDMTDGKVLALPFCMKGCSAANKLSELHQSTFEPAGFEYVQDIDYRHYMEHDKIIVDPILRDRTSYRTFVMNLLIGASRGFHIYPVLITK